MTEPMAEQQAPVCPRHPDRVSYVRCQRCGRPTCPECQRPAAVGVQCVDCVREGQKGMRTPRTQFGAAVTTGRPVVTLTIIAICVVVWLAQQVSPTVTQELSFAPYQGVSEPWRLRRERQPQQLRGRPRRRRGLGRNPVLDDETRDNQCRHEREPS